VSSIREIAMYYPYIHVRDDDWLKAAALYWPRLARLAPEGYPRHDSEVAKILDSELGFLLKIEPPSRQVNQVAADFLEFVASHHRELRERYAVDARNDCVPLWHDAQREMPLQFSRGWHIHSQSIHIQKMTNALRQELIYHGLGKLIENDTWLVVHPALGAAYTMTLIDRIAQANQLAVVTDQPALHELHGGDVGEEFSNVLLEPTFQPEDSKARNTDQVAALYAAIAINAVIPKNIGNVPTKKIVKARTTLAAEFDAFRDHLNTLAEEFSELTSVENLTILQERLQMMADRDPRRPTAALERSLRQLGLEPANAILGLKTLELPALAAAATSAAGIPVVAGEAGLATARLIAASARARSKRRDARQSSPAGYLLGLKRQIGRRSFTDRIRHPLD